jgi:SNF2 family DNA or RNA helicase
VRLDLTDHDTVELRCGKEEIERCHIVPGGRWRQKKQCWEYPVSCLLDIREAWKGETVTVGVGVRDYLASLEHQQATLSGVKQGVTRLDDHPFLMEHQKKCRLIAKYFQKFAFFADTGTGKTITSLSIIQDKACKFIVVCPKSIIKAAWVEDAKNFYQDMRVLPISRNMSADDYTALYKEWNGSLPPRKMTKDVVKYHLMDMAQVFVINPESFKADIELIKKLGIQGLILDESTIIKNPNSQITKVLTEFADALDYVYILSGKPAPNNTMDYFAQMRLIDVGLLGDSFYSFRQRYYTPTGYLGHEWLPQPGAEDEITKRISRAAIFISKEECLDLPEKTYLVRTPEMPKEALRYYRQMEAARVVLLEDDTVTAANKLSELMKLRQITSGFVINEDGVDKPLHDAKIQELLDVLDQIGGKQVIIWANFQAEIRRIEHILQIQGRSVVTAYGGTKDVDKSIVDFKEGRAQYIIAHPQTLKFGVTFTNCNYAVYYSLSYSYEDYYQSHDRIYRKGQTKPCTFIFLLMQDTIDEVIYLVLQQKGTAADVIEQMIRRG